MAPAKAGRKRPVTRTSPARCNSKFCSLSKNKEFKNRELFEDELLFDKIIEGRHRDDRQDFGNHFAAEGENAGIQVFANENLTVKNLEQNQADERGKR